MADLKLETGLPQVTQAVTSGYPRRIYEVHEIPQVIYGRRNAASMSNLRLPLLDIYHRYIPMKQKELNEFSLELTDTDRARYRRCAVSNGMINLAREFLESGTPPDDIYSGMMGAAMALMMAQGMSEMQIANRLKLLIDQAQDKAFGV